MTGPMVTVSHHSRDAASAWGASGDPGTSATRIPAAFLEALRCPVCAGQVAWDVAPASCRSCGTPVDQVNGVAILVADRHGVEHDEIDHLLGHDHSEGEIDHKTAQATYFDRPGLVEFEIERPNGAPALYRYLLTEKARRAIAGLGDLGERTALTVCGGSGMDAEFLARRGARVISADISIGASGRVVDRAGRHGVPITSIVADVEHLPFRDQSIDVVLVHDGLHHLVDPTTGIAEMARVARRAVSITEPARAVATSIAVRLGLALDREEAGNPVARLDPAAVVAQLEAAGFRIVRRERYAMLYRHVPGRAMRALSEPRVLPLVKTAWRWANRLVGRFGNKLVIVAERVDPRDA